MEVDRLRRPGLAAAALSVDHSRFLSPGAADGLSRSWVRPARRRVSIATIAYRRRLGRIQRRRPDGEQAEIVLSPGSPHRFYLRGDLRRTRLHRRVARDPPLCCLRLARIARFVHGAGWFRPAAGAGNYRYGDEPGAD